MSRSSRGPLQDDPPDYPPRLSASQRGSSYVSQRSNSNSDIAKHEEDLINALEAEEERMVNALTRKLEKLRAEKAQLECTLEAEGEMLVNKLQKQLQALMLQQQSSAAANKDAASASVSPVIEQSETLPPRQFPLSPQSQDRSRTQSTAQDGPDLSVLMASPQDLLNPSVSRLNEVLRDENTSLRNRLAESEQALIRTMRFNDVYRSELIELRRRAGKDVGDLVGAPSGAQLIADRKQTYEDLNFSGLGHRGRLNSNTQGTAAKVSSIAIPGVTPAALHPTSRTTYGFSPMTASKSKQPFSMQSSTLPPSTPLSPSSYLASSTSTDSNNTNMTTPSTSYTNPPQPLNTPLSSPSVSSNYLQSSRRTLGESAILDDESTSPNSTRFASRSSSMNGRVAETGQLRRSVGPSDASRQDLSL
ncbi:uncharacterized protein L969DRAFT_94645 [Mixia osmundae IAM 14324]|uniref:Uncharacterized protein n=1 Tax=Mixia osmundae (strain CBS 9802 / IAM 14324 / JCM 22182 / KY 12970) TaxID=764103 RepID=G7DVW6_MIXOS|nr:uncharacterized protein L969DRAFT_94645 [Mixia osmundae IAM 14324]KEI39592.1 hypothetical protein L969DRAFT_94645 [Mixia osmundae IAM 14324]GAA94726.1 hypothetical protein E5Q_01380 [Mixia osmundae IAM 14324]